MRRNFEALVQAVVDAAQRAGRGATLAEIRIGQASHAAVLRRLGPVRDPGSRRRLRGEALGIIRAELGSAGFVVNVSRAIASFAVTELYGVAEGRALPLVVVRAFSKTLRRDTKREEWSVKAKHEEKARAAWSQVTSGEISAAAAVESVATMMSEGKPPKVPKPKPSPVKRIIAQVATLSKGEQQQVVVAIAQMMKAVRLTPRPPAAAPPAAPPRPIVFDDVHPRAA